MLLLLLLCHCAFLYGVSVSPRSYAVLFDCGSTGTRVHVFSWPTDGGGEVGGLPDVRAEPGGYKKVSPGISSFEPNPEAAGASLVPLLELAEGVVPKAAHADTRVLLRATAGMRLLARRRAQRIYTSLYEAVAARHSFSASRDDFGTLSGEDEGIFGWLSANYLLKKAGRLSDLGSVGALDLGGGSTQITVATTAHASESSFIDPRLAAEVDHPTPPPQPRVALPSGSLSVFTHSHLGFGNKAVLAAMTASEAAACLAEGASSTWEPSNKSADYSTYLNRGANEGAYLLRGRGDFDACDRAVRRVLSAFDRHGQPPLRGSKPRRFVAMSLFFYVEHFISVSGHLAAPAAAPAGAAGPAKPMLGVSAAQVLSAASKLCSEPETSLRRLVGRDPLTTEDALRWRCFDAVYVSRLLTDGYGFDEHDPSIDFVGDIDGVEVEWTLGALLHSFTTQHAGAAAGHPSHARSAHHPLPHAEPAGGGYAHTPVLLAGLAALGLVAHAARRVLCAPRSPRSSPFALPAEKDSWA